MTSIKEEIETKTTTTITIRGKYFEFIKYSEYAVVVKKANSDFTITIGSEQELEELIEILTKAREYFEEENGE